MQKLKKKMGKPEKERKKITAQANKESKERTQIS